MKYFKAIILITFVVFLTSQAFTQKTNNKDTYKNLKTSFENELGAKKIKTRTKLHILKYEDVDAQISRILSWLNEHNMKICKSCPQQDFFQLKFQGSVFLPGAISE